MNFIVRHPVDCTPGELAQFHALVIKGGQVSEEGLYDRIEGAHSLGFCYDGPKLVGVAALKRPAEEPVMITNCAANEGYEISPRFRRTIEERIARLERDAASDEALAGQLEDGDHIRRQMRLVAVERAEALRMRLFLDRARTRLPRPLIEI